MKTGNNPSARETILASIRHSLRNTDPAPRTKTLAPKATGRPGETFAKAELAYGFCSSLQAVGGQVHRTSTCEEARACVLQLVRTAAAKNVFSSNTPRLRDWLADEPVAVTVPGDDRSRMLEAEVGITEAQFGIAETGTIVLTSDREEHRLASLLPRTHIALLFEHDLVAGLGEALLKLQSEGIPPVVTFITGPSRTGDIELTLVVGVHGPEILHVVLVGDSSPAAQPGKPNTMGY